MHKSIHPLNSLLNQKHKSTKLDSSCLSHRLLGPRTQVILGARQRRARPPAEIDLIQSRHADWTAHPSSVEAEADPRDDEYRDGNVAGEEVRHAEASHERLEAVEEDDDDEPEDAHVGHVGLEPGPEGQVVSVDALGVEGALEADIAAADARPGDEGAQGRQVGQPGEGGGGAAGDRQEGEEAEAEGQDDSVVRGTRTACLEEDGRHGALAGKGHHGPGQAVGVLVARGQGRGHHHGVDDRGEDLDARLLADDDEGRGGGGVAAGAHGADEFGRVLAQVDADDDDGDDVQAHDTVKDSLGGALHGLARVVGLTSDDADGLDTAVGEGGLGEHLPEAEEASLADSLDSAEVVVPGLLAPVFATGVDTVDASDVSDDAEDDQTDEEGDLEAGEAKFCFSVVFDAEEVDRDADDEEDDDIDREMR